MKLASLLVLLLSLTAVAQNRDNRPNKRPDRKRTPRKQPVEKRQANQKRWKQWDGNFKLRKLPPWVERQYYGVVGFDLKDDPILRQLSRDLREMNQTLESYNQTLETRKRELREVQRTEATAQVVVDQIQDKIDKKNSRISELNTAKAQAQRNLPQLQRRLSALQTRYNSLKAQYDSVQAQHDKLVLEKKPLQDKYDLLAAQKRQLIQQCLKQWGPRAQLKCSKIPAVVALQAPMNELLVKMAPTNQKIKNLAPTLRQKKVAYEQVKAPYDVAKKAVVDANQDIRRAQNRIPVLQSEIRQLNNEISVPRQNLRVAIQNTRVKQESVDSQLTLISELQVQISEKESHAKEVKRNIIALILTVNERGYEKGNLAGKNEGNNMAYEIGEDEGAADGDEKGFEVGQRIGQAREYAQGSIDGKEEARIDANSNGESDGKALGKDQGNKLAGITDGINQGEADALLDKDKAETAGKNNGIELGLQDAHRDGKKNGEKQGQEEAIYEYESQKLSNQIVKGSFAGTYEFYVPNFPGPDGYYYEAISACRDLRVYRAIRNHRRVELLRQACIDGYDYGYRVEAEDEFNRLISNIYTNSYNDAKLAAQTWAESQYYQDSYDSGKTNGYNEIYPNLYETIKENWRSKWSDKYESDPEKTSSEYQSAYASNRSDTYNRIYAEYFDAQERAFRKSTYIENIKSITDEYKSAKKSDVSSIYQKYPVLRFVSSEISDAGIEGIAALDGIYQPNESILVDVVIKNYGLVAANNVKIKLGNGSVVNLPQIPAQSVTTIKSAAKATANGVLSQTSDVVVTLENNLQSNLQDIEGKYYSNISNGNIVFGLRHRYFTQYPLTVTDITADSQILFNKQINLSASVKNISKRKYEGALELRMRNSIGNHIVVSDFNNLSLVNVSGSTNAKGAKVLVSDEKDALESLTITADIYQNGVKVGQTEKSFSELVKIAYIAKQNAPVVITDSNSSARELLDIISNLGGIESASVIDLAVQNQSVVNSGLKDKIVYLTNSLSVLSMIENFSKKSQNLLVSLSNNQRLERFKELKKDGFFQSATYITDMRISGLLDDLDLLRSSPYQEDTKTSGVNFVGVSSERNEELKVLASYLSMNHDALISKVRSMTSFISAQNPSDEQVIATQMLVAKTLLEAEDLYRMYRDKREKDWRKKMGSDKSLLMSKLPDSLYSDIKGKNENAMMTMILTGDMLEYALDKISPFDDYNSIGRDFFKSIKSAITGNWSKAHSKAVKNMKKALDRDQEKVLTNVRNRATFLPYQL